MKKSILSLIALFLFVGVVSAQDASSAFKEAKKMWSKYIAETDVATKAEILDKAGTSIELATADESAFDEKDRFKLWSTKAEILNEVARTYVNNKFTTPTFDGPVNSAGDAFAAIKMGMKYAEKKWMKSDLVSALVENANHMSNVGRLLYQDKDYKGAFTSFNDVVEARKMLMDNGSDKFLPGEAEYNEHLYMTGLSAFLAEETTSARDIFKQLYDVKYDNPAVYEGLFKTMVADDEAGALEVLAEGRKQFPEDEGLLIAEINQYIQGGKLDELVGKLQGAIKADPTNVSYYSTLGKVYDDLYQREEEAGNSVKAEEHFESALKYYSGALEQQPDFLSAIYNTGALYYNKAALLNRELIALDGDYSKAGLAKFEAKKKEVFSMFDKALPFFKKAEKLEPNDLGTLSALKEIFARKDDLVTSNEFKARMEKVNNKEKIETSFFKDEE